MGHRPFQATQAGRPQLLSLVPIEQRAYRAAHRGRAESGPAKGGHSIRYLLNEDVGLRSWRRVPFAYYRRSERNARRVSKETFDLLLRCDGIREIPDNAPIAALVARGLCHPAGAGERLTDWQRYRSYDNEYFPALNWMLTGKCNLNCLHCFNAADNARLQSEFQPAEAMRLIDEAAACGIHAFTLTGGEPMFHRDFMRIFQRIYERDMFVEELNTNGTFITREMLREMRAMGAAPRFKISFDGVGCHDWLRNQRGAEQSALRAFEMCLEEGFEVMAQTNVHRLNADAMLPTARMLSGMGAGGMRIIRTSEAPRWVQNAGGAGLSWSEYYDRMLAFLEAYVQTGCTMNVNIWQMAAVCPASRKYRPAAVGCDAREYRDSLPVCRCNRGLVAVAADGNLYPCLQVSGYYVKCGRFLGNVKADGLRTHLQQGAYLSEVQTTLKQLKEHSRQCADCPWFRLCCGGCRACAAALTGDRFGVDPSKCLFFQHGYLEKLADALKGYECVIRLPAVSDARA